MVSAYIKERGTDHVYKKRKVFWGKIAAGQNQADILKPFSVGDRIKRRIDSIGYGQDLHHARIISAHNHA
jgi:hypothetical protein